jgi:molybdopterin/thiamine biosynthesis adenylyltransferase
MVDRTRHAAIFDASRTGITLIGLGGIGAITALTLAKMGVLHLSGIDPDEVSEENVATQMYKSSDVGRSKAIVTMLSIINDYATDVNFTYLDERVDELTVWGNIANEIIISGVDSIESRQDIWAAIWDEPWLWYIDARMGAESLLIYTVNGKDRQWYNDMIGSQDDSQIPNDPCTSKATFYCGAAAAAFIGSTVRKIITGRTPPTVLSLNLVENVLITNGS